MHSVNDTGARVTTIWAVEGAITGSTMREVIKELDT